MAFTHRILPLILVVSTHCTPAARNSTAQSSDAPQSTPYKRSDGRPLRVGLTDTMYPQFRAVLQHIGSEPVDLVSAETVAAYIMNAHLPLLDRQSQELQVKPTGPGMVRVEVAAYEAENGPLDRYFAERRGRVESPLAPEFLAGMIDMNKVHAAVRNLDALLVGGGEDVNPLLYLPPDAAARHPHGTLHRTRDVLELAFIGAALQQGKPILGVCRGSQILAVAVGGRLINVKQSFPALAERHYPPSELQHSRGHDAQVRGGTLFAQLLGIPRDTPFNVNTYHNNAVAPDSRGIEVGAFDFPGSGGSPEIVEGFTVPGKGFTVGIQSHPERPHAESDEAPARTILDPVKLFPQDRPYYKQIFLQLQACAAGHPDCRARRT